MNKILLPELYESENFYKYFQCDHLSDLEDKLNYLYENYPNAILDVFENSLSADDPQIALLDSNYFKLTQEIKYINFINKCFDMCRETCYINIEIDFENFDNFLYYFPLQDTVDKYIFLNIFKKATKKNDFYKIVDRMLLTLFIKNGLREQMHFTIYFPDIEMLLFSNYDLSLPIVFKKKIDMDMYQKILTENELFFRDKSNP